jgi:hypothetical protein
LRNSGAGIPLNIEAVGPAANCVRELPQEDKIKQARSSVFSWQNLQNGWQGGRIAPKVGRVQEELLRILGLIRWTEAESSELRKAIDAVSEVIRYAGRD